MAPLVRTHSCLGSCIYNTFLMFQLSSLTSCHCKKLTQFSFPLSSEAWFSLQDFFTLPSPQEENDTEQKTFPQVSVKSSQHNLKLLQLTFTMAN